jgi:putative transposase
MPRSIYAEINLHITWHTKDGATPIHGEVETRLHAYLRNRVVATDGVRFHAVGGLEDHVHLAVSVPPTLLVSEWIGGLKGASAHYVNHEGADRKVLEWQSGYGVVSFGTKDLAWVVRYVEKQRERHSACRIYARLEKAEASAG